MYPSVDKGQMPSAPPSYSESVNAQKYMVNAQQGGPIYPECPPQRESYQPTQVVVVQVPGRKCSIFVILSTLYTDFLFYIYSLRIVSILFFNFFNVYFKSQALL